MYPGRGRGNQRTPPTGPRLDRRPQSGRPQERVETKDRAIVVTTNCFRITKLPTAEYVMYDVTFAPENGEPIKKDHVKRKEELVRHMQNMVAPHVFTVPLLYDGGAIAYAHPNTSNALGSEQTFRVHLRHAGPPPPEIRNAVVIKLKLTKAGTIAATEINEVVIHGRDSPRRTELLNFMQLIVRQATNNVHANNGRAYFPERGLNFPGHNHLELRTGIFHSVRPAIGQAVVVVDTSVAIFYRKFSLIDALLAFFNTRDIRFLEKSEGFKERLGAINHIFKGIFIRETKGGRKGGRRKIKGFQSDGALYQFENDDGVTLTIAQHYQQVNNQRLAHHRLPGVIVATKPKLIIIPMELCDIEPNQFYRKAMNDRATSEIMSIARLDPPDKMDAIKEGARQYQLAQALNFSGMEVESRPLDVPAIVKPPPQVQYSTGVAVVRDGKWNLIRQKVIVPAKHSRWALLNLALMKMPSRDLDRHISSFVQGVRALGLSLDNTPLIQKSAGPQQLTMVLEELRRDIEKTCGSGIFNPDKSKEPNCPNFFVLIILEKDGIEPRSVLKHWGDVAHGIVTQCVCVDKVTRLSERSAPQYWANVALKLNPRLGGENSRVAQSNVMNELAKTVSMIVGADVGHPGPGVYKPSTVALVYNLNPFATKYGAITQLQDPRQEIVSNLESMMKEAMEALMEIARSPLKNIVFFRDGVSEGEYDAVKDVEVKAINAAIDALWATYKPLVNKGFPKPKLTYLVVGKRHHTIFFPAQRMASEKIENCPAGVVVNQGITQPTTKDFYLLSHAAIIGTSRSSHYIVLQDEVFGGDTPKIEELAYALCHVYAKATRSVSIPAPVYYADLVCLRHSYHFAPGVEYRLRAANSPASEFPEQRRPPFDLQPWRASFEPPHRYVRHNMYFL
ncbi:Piwi-domain-containing protein [Coprinellus micaceus]|uniref:Piwi-domain-containing protein n=1 Tax=Coprinellus micaceus TaxID=71717 RepID=A0A4Y7TP48_COPMI|nr:Piwi-domain-containing protein [Coprinellus micaceus]